SWTSGPPPAAEAGEPTTSAHPAIAAGLDPGDTPRAQQSRHVLSHAASLDRLGEGLGVGRAVDEAMGRDLVEVARLGEIGEQPLLAALDHGGEAVEPLQERGAALEDADVVEGGVPARVARTHAGQRALEVLQVAPGVAVV